MSDVNCLSSDFWDKPLNIDWDNKKFGYCVIAVFGKRKGFERTYMIPWTARKRTLYPVKRNLTIYTLDEIYPKVYNMCVESEANFDSAKAVLCFFSKSLEKWKSKRVYALYINPLYKQNSKPDSIINYCEQLGGEEADLSDAEIENILNDVENRYAIIDYTYHYNAPVCKPNSHTIGDNTKSIIRDSFFCINNTRENLIVRHNRQTLCSSLGVSVSEWGVPLIEYENQIRRNLVKELSGYNNDYRGPAIDLLLSNIILNAKCIYQSAIYQIFGSEDEANADSLKDMIDKYFSKRNNKISVSFNNFNIMFETLILSIKIMSVGLAKEAFIRRTIDMRYRSVASCALIDVHNHLALHPPTEGFSDKDLMSKRQTDILVKNSEFYQDRLRKKAQYIPMFYTFYDCIGHSIFGDTFDRFTYPICDGKNAYVINFNNLSNYSREDIINKIFPV